MNGATEDEDASIDGQKHRFDSQESYISLSLSLGSKFFGKDSMYSLAALRLALLFDVAVVVVLLLSHDPAIALNLTFAPRTRPSPFPVLLPFPVARDFRIRGPPVF